MFERACIRWVGRFALEVPGLPADGEPRELAKHAGDAVARHSRRAWRLDKVGKRDSIDAIVALAMAVERAEARPEPARVLGWL